MFGTRFWMDLWVSDFILKENFPMQYVLESNKNCLIHDRWENGQWRWSWLRNIPNGGRTCQQLQDMQNELQYLELNNQEDAWKWQLAKDGVFSVSCTRKHIDNILLNSGDIATRWNNLVPIKVNILVWRISLDRLPTRINLIKRGIDVPSLLCPSCGNQIEDVSHIFVTCEVTFCIWDRVFRWLDTSRPVFSNIEDIFTWIDSLTIRLNRRKVLDAILVTVLWVIWRYWNNKIFGLVKMNRSNIFDDVISIVFEWCSSRSKDFSKNWTLWLQNPMLHTL
ncbi:RNA-directed DNA polymerase, eukaryota [Tanacetum coccineum]